MAQNRTEQNKTKHSTPTKVKVALEALKGEKTTAEITAKHSIHATQINTWKKAALEILPEAFSSKRKRQENDQQALIDELYKQIGQLKVENYFLKKTLIIPLEIKKMWVEAEHKGFSVRKQCGFLGIDRSSLYYHSVGVDNPQNFLMFFNSIH
jgi:transposase-like protein